MKRLFEPTRLLVVLCLLDLVITLWVLGFGDGAEGNPFMGRFLAYGVGAFVATKLALVIGPISILAWARRRRPAFVRRSTWFALTAYVVLYCSGSIRANWAQAQGGGNSITRESPIQQPAARSVTSEKGYAERYGDRTTVTAP